MARNFFETGGNEQYLIIKPFIEVLKVYNPGDTGNSDQFISFFIRQLKEALKKREEEILPEWARDVRDYVMKSEILICSTLYATILKREIPPICQDEIDYLLRSKGTQYKSEFKDIGSYISILASLLYKEIKELGYERGWDLNILHLQILKTILGTYQRSKVSSKVLCGKDYN